MLHGKHRFRALREKPLVVIERWRRPHFLQVVPGAKCFAFGTQHYYAHGCIGGNRVELALQGRKHRLRQGVESVRPVQSQRNHAAPILAAQHNWFFNPEIFRNRCRFNRYWSGFHGWNALTFQRFNTFTKILVSVRCDGQHHWQATAPQA